MLLRSLLPVCLSALLSLPCYAQSNSPAAPNPPAAQAKPPALPKPPAPPKPPADPFPPPTRAAALRGAYGPYRANNDLLTYHLTVRVDPEQKAIRGHNLVRFRMLRDGRRIQLDLTESLGIDRILLADAHGTDSATELHYVRDSGAVFIDFPETLRRGRTYALDFFYSGTPVATGRFGCLEFRKDPAGRPWITTACEESGASVWWPNKDQWRDEVQSMDISVEVPNALTDISNGRFAGKQDLGDGYTRWNWHVSYPINAYDVALSIGSYVHFGDHMGPLTMDYWVLPEDLEKAKRQFTQVRGMLETFGHYFGEYPFVRDGYKLIQVPYAGMEHQSAVGYGNGFKNSYIVPDWTGVGISPRFDFIIIHESGHEWFGNSITAKDVSDMWIHEGWTTYLECLYVERMYGHADEVRYVNSLKKKVRDQRPILTERGINSDPPIDQYFKGALMLNTLRSIVDDDPKWFRLIHAFYQRFKYQTIATEDVVAFFNHGTGLNLTPVFDQYLRYTEIPRLELVFLDRSGAGGGREAPAGTVMYKWGARARNFRMPVKVGTPGHWQTIHPTQQWQTMTTPLTREQFGVATELFYVDVDKM